jgi:hypothetical protein
VPVPTGTGICVVYGTGAGSYGRNGAPSAGASFSSPGVSEGVGIEVEVQLTATEPLNGGEIPLGGMRSGRGVAIALEVAAGVGVTVK